VKANEVVTTPNGVKIVGNSSVERLAATASNLYARNLYAFIETLIDKTTKAVAVKWDDELVKATNLTRDGAIVHPAFAGAPVTSATSGSMPVAPAAGAAAPAATPAPAPVTTAPALSGAAPSAEPIVTH
jgi:NAD(P) transhydrogenase subunit alpha